MATEEARDEERFTLRLAPALADAVGVVEGALRRSLAGTADRTTVVRVLLVAALRGAAEVGALRAGAATINLDGEERAVLNAALSRLS